MIQEIRAIMTIQQKITEAIQVIRESASRVNTPQARRLGKRLRRKLAAYFRTIQNDFPYAQAASVYKQYEGDDTVTTDKVLKQIDKKLTQWLDRHKDILTTIFDDELPVIAGAGFMAELNDQRKRFKLPPIKNELTREAYIEEKKKDIELPIDLPVSDDIKKWTKEHGAELVTGMDDATKGRMAELIKKGLDEQRGVPNLSRLLRDEFPDMSKQRADLIAQTELNKALSEGADMAAKEVGSKEKEWISVGDDRVRDEHLDNEGQGRIPIDQTFSSGEDLPGLPECRCAVAYYGATKTSVNDVM